MLAFVMSGTMSQVLAWLDSLVSKYGNLTIKQILDQACF